MLPKFEYWQSGDDGQWYFHLKAPRDLVIIQSAGYTSVEECLLGIDQLKRYVDIAIIAPQQMISIL